MISKNNLSPNQLSFIAALASTLPFSVLLLFLKIEWKFILFSLVMLMVLSYSIFLYVLNSFTRRHIKLIYKMISQTKASKREEFYYKNLLPEKNIEEVREDVENWAAQQKKEFEILQQNEIFRKEFLQNLSHELKTPIFSIQGYVETLINGAAANPELRQKFLLNTSRNIERLVNLVDDLDEISKLESGQLKLHFETFSIQEILKEVFESLQMRSQENNISFVFKKGTESPAVFVYADKEKIRQVLTNLVDNAVKYGKTNGFVEAALYRVEGKQVLIEISDDGSGIAEEHLLRIFERFYRTDLARSRKAGGSGLGLAICKHIVEAHHQTIHVRSKQDVGTTFGFQLPVGKS